jgi:hypothetical protein
MAGLFCVTLSQTALSEQQGTLRGRLIRLDVVGSQDVRVMLEGFLTSQNLILVDDNGVACLHVRAAKEVAGHPRNATVRYVINRLELRLPGDGLAYSNYDLQAYDYGEVGMAARSALHLLRSYLVEDEILKDRLGRIRAQGYYDLGPVGETARSELKTIERGLLELARKMEANDEVKERLLKLENEVAASSEELLRLARSIAAGQGRISESSVRMLLDYQKQMLRTKKAPYLISRRCPAAEQRAYGDIKAALIRVPLGAGDVLTTGRYSIFAENQRIVYPHGTLIGRPRFFSSTALLRRSSLGDLFQSGQDYLDIEALAFHSEDRAIIISNCDADALMYANMRGESPDKIFAEGRVVVVPGRPLPTDIHENP